MKRTLAIIYLFLIRKNCLEPRQQSPNIEASSPFLFTKTQHNSSL
jgi:hypothetical protein